MDAEIDYGIVYIFTVASLSAMVLVGGFIAVFVLYQKRQIKNWKEKKQLEAKHQKGLLKAFIETQEKERKRIAADLHDEIGASLAAAKMMISQVKLESDEQKKQINEGLDIIVNTADNARRISHNLMPPSLETVGLKKTLSRLLENTFSEAVQYQFDFDSTIKFKPEIELALYRISQELINNTLKYAKANEVILKVKALNSQIEYHYFDNGVGYDQKAQMGLGLQNIESRCQSIGASVHFYNQPGRTGLIIKFNENGRS